MRRGDVWWATLQPRSGSEQSGRRPVVVLSHDSFKSRQADQRQRAFVGDERFAAGALSEFDSDRLAAHHLADFDDDALAVARMPYGTANREDRCRVGNAGLRAEQRRAVCQLGLQVMERRTRRRGRFAVGASR